MDEEKLHFMTKYEQTDKGYTIHLESMISQNIFYEEILNQKVNWKHWLNIGTMKKHFFSLSLHND